MIKRNFYLNKIKPYINKDLIKIISGIRRCGKSTILQQLIEELKQNGVKEDNIIYINLELQKYFDVRTKEQLMDVIEKQIKNRVNYEYPALNQIADEDKIYIFIDEIQNVDSWELLINSYLAEKQFDIYITGSNSKLLSGELATHLTGRFVEIKVYPFSYLEFLEYHKLNNENMNEDINENKLIKEYIQFGGMPYSLGFEEDQKIEYLSDLYYSIVLKDIIKRNEIRDVDLVDRIFFYILANIGHTFSANSIFKYFKKDQISVSINTIYNYLSYMEDACLVNKVRRENIVSKKLLNHGEKFYLNDLGFREAIYGYNNRNKGQVIENIVYIELLRRGYKITIGKFKDKEVDFVCKKRGKKAYIQVSYVLADENTIKREFEPLIKIKDNYPKYIISTDEFDFSKNGVIHINLADFLKGKTIKLL
ncbi:MAG: ATP-binding protein [Methanobrevibacter sp.]|nr:ATP-binding protein [Candidatus Methanoflexus mossambicus]